MKIIENKDECTVSINGFKIDGFVVPRLCEQCEKPIIFYETYDSHFCPYSNSWLDPKCSDSECEFCKDRPDKPLPNNLT